MNAPLSNLDWPIIGGFLIAVLSVGFWGTKKSFSLLGFFLADRQQKWPVIGLSLFATSISSSTIIGLCGAAYITGLSISAYEWSAPLILIFIAIYLVPSLLKNNIITIPEFLEKRFDYRMRCYFSLLTILMNILIEIVGVLFAGTLVLKEFFPQVDFLTISLIVILIAGSYTAIGGLRAVMSTGLLQAIIILASGMVLSWSAFRKIGSWEQISQLTPSEMLSLIRPASDPTMPWTGLLLGVPLLVFASWGTNQMLVQQVLAAKNIQQARWGMLLAGFLKLMIIFLFVLPGIMARFIYPNLSMGDGVMPQLITSVLPYGLKGLVLAGLLAAMISSIDAALHSISTLATMDFIRRFHPATSEGQLIQIGRIITVMVMAVSIACLPIISSMQGMFAYFQNALSYLLPQMVAIFLLGLFCPAIQSGSAFWGTLSGHLSALVVWCLGYFAPHLLPNLHLLVWAGIFALITCLITFIISYCSSPQSTDQGKCSLFHQEAGSSWQDYHWYCVILFFCTVFTVVAFW